MIFAGIHWQLEETFALTFACCTARLTGNGASKADKAGTGLERGPLDDIYIKQLIWQHKHHVFKAGGSLPFTPAIFTPL